MPHSEFSAEEPKHPHFVCRDGYWWHHDPRKHGCYAGRTAQSTSEIEALFYGAALSRGIAIDRLTAGAMLSIYSDRCTNHPAITNHKVAADNLGRAARALTSPIVRLRARDLPARTLLRIAAIRGATDQETERRQLLAIASSSLP